MELLGELVGMGGGYEEDKEPEQMCGSNGRGREQTQTTPGTLVR